MIVADSGSVRGRRRPGKRMGGVLLAAVLPDQPR
jgi:hypothetical protein